LIISTKALRQTERLIELSADDQLDGHLADLLAQAKADPQRMVELIVKLTERVAAALPPRPHSPIELRRAHAAYTLGDRGFWAAEGERTYQREKKRRLRAAARAGLQAAS
jgi:hypothetical protein